LAEETHTVQIKMKFCDTSLCKKGTTTFSKYVKIFFLFDDRVWHGQQHMPSQLIGFHPLSEASLWLPTMVSLR